MIQTTTLAVPGMTSGTCERHVMRALEGMTGVMDVQVDPKEQPRSTSFVDETRQASKAMEAFGRELETQTALEPDMEAEICASVSRLAGTLKPEYAEALQAIDVNGTPVKAFASSADSLRVMLACVCSGPGRL